MRITCTVDDDDVIVEGEYGNEVKGIIVGCNRCQYSVEVAGRSEASAKRGAVMLREECPKGEKNFYVVDYDGED